MSEIMCPYCGAESDKIIRIVGCYRFECRTSIGTTGPQQSALCKTIEDLRNHNRDLQQAYDHIVKLEQDRCREVVEARDELQKLKDRIEANMSCTLFDGLT